MSDLYFDYKFGDHVNFDRKGLLGRFIRTSIAAGKPSRKFDRTLAQTLEKLDDEDDEKFLKALVGLPWKVRVSHEYVLICRNSVIGISQDIGNNSKILDVFVRF